MFIPQGTVVTLLSGSTAVATGTERRCQMAGCTGVRVGVRKQDGKIRFPCSKALVQDADGNWKCG